MIAGQTFAKTVSALLGTKTMRTRFPLRPSCTVSLIDRRTGTAHRINGTPLTIRTDTPNDAAADLLRNRDPAVWDVRIDHSHQEARG